MTAAHCVSDTAGHKTLSSGTASVLTNNSTTQIFSITGTAIHPLWDGDLFSGYDVALIRGASAFTNISTLGLYTFFNENQTYDVYGYGRQGSNGTGATIGPGGVKKGQNTFDATSGPRILLSDFDNGTAQRDAFAVHLGFAPHTGLGLSEVRMQRSSTS